MSGELLPSCFCSMVVNPPPTPPTPHLPHRGVVGAPAGMAGDQLTNTSPRPTTSLSSPTWPSVVRGEAREGTPACPRSQPAIVTAADFSALYQRCVASGLKASVNISHVAGCQVLTVLCTIPAPAMTETAAGRRRQRRPLLARNRRYRHHQPLSPQSPLQLS